MLRKSLVWAVRAFSVGSRSIDINGDRQLIEISGICRPRDIASDNTILSTYISDAQIAYNGTGGTFAGGMANKLVAVEIGP